MARRNRVARPPSSGLDLAIAAEVVRDFAGVQVLNSQVVFSPASRLVARVPLWVVLPPPSVPSSCTGLSRSRARVVVEVTGTGEIPVLVGVDGVPTDAVF